MAQQVADRRDQDFVIWEQMECEEILKNENYQEFNRKTCDMILTEARALAIKELLPLMAEGDEQGVKLENGTVKVPDYRVEGLSKIIKPKKSVYAQLEYLLPHGPGAYGQEKTGEFSSTSNRKAGRDLP